MVARPHTGCLLLAPSDRDLTQQLQSALGGLPKHPLVENWDDRPTLLATVAQGTCDLVPLGPALASPEFLVRLRALDARVPATMEDPGHPVADAPAASGGGVAWGAPLP